MESKDTLVVNLYAGPSTGKSSTMAGLFAELKWRGLDCEMAPEFAKEKVWEGSLGILENQIYIFAKQLHSINRLLGKVEVVITDSPLLFSLIYGKKMGDPFKNLVLDIFNQHRNLNIFLKRLKTFNPNGRLQSEEEAKAIDKDLLALLARYNVDYVSMDSHPLTIPTLADIVTDVIGKDKFLYS